MSRDQYVARLADQAIAHPRRRIAGLQIASRGNLGKSITRPPERFRCLLCAKLAAVPEEIWSYTALSREAGKSIHGSLPHRRQRTARINLGTNRVAVVHEIEMHGCSPGW